MVLSLQDPQGIKTGPSQRNQVTALFTAFDYYTLERIVGSRLANQYSQSFYKTAQFIL